jgi:hypothetical protein
MRGSKEDPTGGPANPTSVRPHHNHALQQSAPQFCNLNMIHDIQQLYEGGMTTPADAPNLPTSRLNDLPTAEEVQFSKSAIQQLDTSIQHLQYEISRLQSQVQCLQHRRAEFAWYIAPIRRVPAEILRQIILFCLDDGYGVTEMSHTCSQIRQLIIRMPSLWSKIHLSPGYRPNRYTTQVNPLL